MLSSSGSLLQNGFRIGDGGENVVQRLCRDASLLNQVDRFRKADGRKADMVAIDNRRIPSLDSIVKRRNVLCELYGEPLVKAFEFG
jgi:hypothetical protein